MKHWLRSKETRCFQIWVHLLKPHSKIIYHIKGQSLRIMTAYVQQRRTYTKEHKIFERALKITAK